MVDGYNRTGNVMVMVMCKRFQLVWSISTLLHDYREHQNDLQQRKKNSVLSQCMDPYTFCNYVEY